MQYIVFATSNCKIFFRRNILTSHSIGIFSRIMKINMLCLVFWQMIINANCLKCSISFHLKYLYQTQRGVVFGPKISKENNLYLYNFQNFLTISYLIFVTPVSCGIHVAMPVALSKVNPSGCWIILYEYVPSSLALNLSSTDSLNLALIWESPLICGISFSKKEGFTKSIKAYQHWKKNELLRKKWIY